MKLKIPNRSSLIVMGLALLCMYVNNPFYIAKIEGINKVLYYCFALLPLTGFLSMRIRIEWGLLTHVVYVLAYVFCAVIVIFVTSSYDIDYLIYLFRLLLNISAMYSFCQIWKYNYEYEKVTIHVGEIYIISLIIYIFGTIIFMILPNVKSIWMSIISLYGNLDLVLRAEYVSRFGFSGFAGYLVSFQTVSGIIYVAYLMLTNLISMKRGSFYIIFLIIGCSFYGRTGLLAAIVVSFLFLFYYIFIKHHSILLLYVLELFGLLAVLFAFLYHVSKGVFRRYIQWAFELFITHQQHGKFTTSSLEEIKYFYKKFQPTIQILLFGEGHWFDKDGGYYGGADVGFMRNIYYGGIIYTIILYGIVIIFLVLLNEKLKIEIKSGKRLLILLMLINMITFELKGDVTFSFIKAYIPLYMGICIHNDKILKENNYKI